MRSSKKKKKKDPFVNSSVSHSVTKEFQAKLGTTCMRKHVRTTHATIPGSGPDPDREPEYFSETSIVPRSPSFTVPPVVPKFPLAPAQARESCVVANPTSSYEDTSVIFDSIITLQSLDRKLPGRMYPCYREIGRASNALLQSTILGKLGPRKLPALAHRNPRLLAPSLVAFPTFMVSNSKICCTMGQSRMWRGTLQEPITMCFTKDSLMRDVCQLGTRPS